MTKPSIVSILLAAALAACQDAPADTHWTGRTDTLADTITVTTVSGTVSGRPPIVVDSVTVLWGADSLSRPRGITRVADVLAVAERDRVYVISPEGEFLRTLGRPGDGPGEFRDIAGVGASGDTLYLFDAEHLRLSAYAGADTLVDTRTFVEAGGFVDLEEGSILVRNGVLTTVSRPRISLGKPVATVIMTHPLSGGAPDTIALVEGPTYYMTEANNLSVTHLFEPRPAAALGPSGEIAWTNGVEYCVNVMPGDSSGIRRICQDWARVPVTDGVSSPDLDALADQAEISERHGNILANELTGTETGGYRNSIDALRWDDSGRLWVRVVDSLQADTHPYLLRWYPELRPPHYQWDVFDTSGRLYAQVAPPSTFSPQAFVGDTIYGFYELETGEQTVGRVVVRLSGR